MLKLLITILLCIFNSDVFGSNVYTHNSTADVTLTEFLKSNTTVIDISEQCMDKNRAHNKQCILDISGFSQDNVNALLQKATNIKPNIRCVNSTLDRLFFSEEIKLGHLISPNDYAVEENEPALVIADNLQLMDIVIEEPFRRGHMYPRFFTIYNNPRLSRESINSFKSMVAEQLLEQKNSPKPSSNRVVAERIKIQNYGECDYQMLNPGKTQLSWEEFRWCRTVLHNITLEGEEFDSGLETAKIIEVKGCLKIKNTKITDLTIIRKINVKPVCSEISGNKDLCISYEDEIVLKSRGFTIENNKELSCRGASDITKAPTTSTAKAPTTSTTKVPTTSTTEAPTTSTTEAPTTSTTEAPTTSTTEAPTTSTREAPTASTTKEPTTSTTEEPTTSTTEKPTTSTTREPTTSTTEKPTTSTTREPTTSTTEKPTTSTTKAPTSTSSTTEAPTSSSTTSKAISVKTRQNMKNGYATAAALNMSSQAPEISRTLQSILWLIFILVIFG